MKSPLREHEKFWAFMALGIGVLSLVAMALAYGADAKDPIIRIVDAATGGFLLALGAATNALFRTGSPADEEMKSSMARIVTENAPAPTPKQVEIVQPAGQPVPVEEANPQSHDDLPPMFREDKA